MEHGWPTVPPPPASAHVAVPRRRRWWPVLLVLSVVALLGVVSLGAAAVWWFFGLDEAHTQAAWREVNREAVARAGPAPAYVGHGCPFSTGAAEVACGTLLVPLDRTDPDSPTIELAVARVAATGPDPAPDPVVYLEGGPGGFAVADHWWWPEEMSALLEQRDVILLDQRGVGYSDPALLCTELWGDPPDGDPHDAEMAALRACHDRLVREGHDLGAYSTPAIAHDVADLRLAMGLAEINLFGVSYGTRVALAVLRDHPEGIRSVVLDSVYPMEVRALEEQVIHAAAAIDLVLDSCEADPGCASRHPDVTVVLDTLVDDLNARPVAIGAGTHEWEVTGDDLIDRIFDALYAPDALERVPAAVSAAAAGDIEEALGLLDGSAGGRARRHWADEDSDGLYYSVTCREDGAVSDPEAAVRLAAQVRPSLGTALLHDVQRTFAVCAFWDAGRADPAEAEPVRSDVPALVLAGEYDPITPAAWSRQAAEMLTLSTYLEFPTLGHAVLTGGECPAGIIADFLDAADILDAPAFTPQASCAVAD